MGTGPAQDLLEDILLPDLPIIDPHHHLLDHSGFKYEIPDLTADTTAGHNIVATVYLECGEHYRRDGDPALAPVGETEAVNRIAESLPRGGPKLCAGIVSRAKLSLGDAVDKVLNAHREAAPHRFCGIRDMTAWDSDPGIHLPQINLEPHLLTDPQFRRGASRLAKHGLPFDAFVYHHQLPDFIGFADAVPDLTIILNHIGAPLGIGRYAGRRTEVFEEWRQSMTELAKRPNVLVKLGGFAMVINGFGWHERETPVGSAELAAATRDWYLTVIDRFGPNRCMFESNFPVDRMSCSYVALWNSFKRIAADLSAPDKAALFHDTAARVYRLGDRK